MLLAGRLLALVPALALITVAQADNSDTVQIQSRQFDAKKLAFPLNQFKADSDSDCKCFPGEDCWPSFAQWNDLNSTVDGHLIPTVPLATPCHGENYNETECKTLRDEWLLPTAQYVSAANSLRAVTSTCLTYTLTTS